MLESTPVDWFSIADFAAIGLRRGRSSEIIAMAGITLGLFTLHQFDDVLREQLLTSFSVQNKFLIRTGILLIITLLAYHTRAIVCIGAAAEPGEGRRGSLQYRRLDFFAGYRTFCSRTGLDLNMVGGRDQ